MKIFWNFRAIAFSKINWPEPLSSSASEINLTGNFETSLLLDFAAPQACESSNQENKTWRCLCYFVFSFCRELLLLSDTTIQYSSRFLPRQHSLEKLRVSSVIIPTKAFVMKVRKSSAWVTNRILVILGKSELCKRNEKRLQIIFMVGTDAALSFVSFDIQN